jgi:hypothetical protein
VLDTTSGLQDAGFTSRRYFPVLLPAGELEGAAVEQLAAAERVFGVAGVRAGD